MFEHLFSPITIKGKTIRNRTAVSAMDTGYSNVQGIATEQMIAYQEKKAKGGYGLLFTEDCGVSQDGITAPNVLGIWSDDQIPSHKKMVEAVHNAGALMFCQLYHDGSSGSQFLLGRPPKTASAVCQPMGDAVPLAMTKEDIEEVKTNFINAAVRAKKAGYDGVELHSAHGYLLLQFVSPLTNKRLDEYGGNLWNRTCLIREIIQGTREACGDDFLIGVRISGDELFEGGMNIEDTKTYALILEQAGVDLLHVSVSDNATLSECMADSYHSSGWITDLAKEVKETVSIPVITVNRINNPFLADQLIATGKADMVAFGRESLADPEMPNKAKAGDLNSIRHCLGCNIGCLDNLWKGNTVHCVINPETGEEAKGSITKAENSQNVAVIGAGPGGLYAAIAAAQRGHHVTVYEAASHAGGNYYSASVPPCKGEITTFLNWQLNECRKLGVEILYNTKITSDNLKDLKADHIINATGAAPFCPPITGLDRDHVIYATDILDGKVFPGRNVVIIGGGEVGAETAHYLTFAGRAVTILEMKPQIAGDAGSAREGLLASLEKRHVQMLTGVSITEVKKDSVFYTDASGTAHEIPTDQVVIATGFRNRTDLNDALEKSGISYDTIGDAKKARNAFAAISEGYWAGRAI